MKIFISHSWMDKDIAQQAGDAVATAGEVWMDVRKLSAGDSIQNTIDAAIRQQDLVILMWSARAAASKNVAAEISAAKRFGIDILPCLLDKTPLETNPDVAGLLGIDMIDPKVGLFRLQIAVMQRFAERAGFTDAQAMEAIKDYDGALQYINDYRNARGIEGADATNWAMRALETTNRAFEKASAWRDRTQGLLELVQSTMARVEQAGNDRAKLEAVLHELRQNQYADTSEVRQIIQFVEGKISTLPRDDFGSFIDGMRKKIAAASRAPLRQMVPAQWAGALESYITSAPESLLRFGETVSAVPSDELKQLAFGLLTYLRANDDVVADDTNGILGYVDDAWLIHNAVYHCITQGWIEQDAIPADWASLTAVDPVAVHLLAPEAQQRLGALYQQLVQPTTASAYQQETGGGSPFIQNATSIDDIYYTVGGKGYWMG